MNVSILIERTKTTQAQRTMNLKREQRELSHVLEGAAQWMMRNAHAQPQVIDAQRRKIADSTKRLAEIEAELGKKWTEPTAKQVRELDALHGNMNQHRVLLGFAETAMETAERDEKPKAAEIARKEAAECRREYEKALKELRKGLEKCGIDPTPLCGVVYATEGR